MRSLFSMSNPRQSIRDTAVIMSPNTRSESAAAAAAAAAARVDAAAACGRRGAAAPSPAPPAIPVAAHDQRVAAAVRADAAHACAAAAVPPVVMSANLGQDFVGEAFAQHGGGIAVLEGSGGWKAMLGKREGGNTVAKSADRFAIQKCVKEYVFPKQKFVCDGNLDFSNNEMSIFPCRAAVLLDVDKQDIENWWEITQKTVKESLYRHTNNIIRKKIKTMFQGKIVASIQSTAQF